MTVWILNVERVRVVGSGTQEIEAAGLQTLVAHALQTALQTAPLPAGRAMCTCAEVAVPSLANGAAVAGAVALGITRAIGGRPHG